MKLGLFIQPLHFPERNPGDCWDEDLDLIIHGDRIGFSEVWIGEHYCIGWENLPAPELLIAKALGLTSNIRLGAGVHVLSYHHPAIIAHKVAALDHFSKGRFLFGIGAGGSPADFEMLGIDFRHNEHRYRMEESIEMILALWSSNGPLSIDGKFWKLKIPFPNKKMTWHFHLRPYQKPYPPIAVAGTSRFSQSLKWCAEKGFIPMSLEANTEILKSHWNVIQQGALIGKKDASRQDWRIARVIYVANTDEEAFSHVRESSLARGFKEYFLRVYKMFNVLEAIKHEPSVPDSAIDVEYALEHLWIVGSIETVKQKLIKFYKEVGGFGTLLVLHFDTHPYPERFKNSMTLLLKNIVPTITGLKQSLVTHF